MRVGSNYAFNRIKNGSFEYSLDSATYKGIGTKTFVLLAITFITSIFMSLVFFMFSYINIFLYPVCLILSLVLQLILVFSPLKAKYLSIPYAVSEGTIIGVLCSLIELAFPEYGFRISALALMITLTIFMVGSLLYAKEVIKVTNKFRIMIHCFMFGSIIFFGLFSIISLIVYLTTRINLFSMYYFSGLGVLGAIIMCFIASCYVIFSIDNAKRIVESNAPKDYEWYASYAITLNVVYLYIEILRLLLVILSRRRD